jgi:hypothetical protein
MELEHMNYSFSAEKNARLKESRSISFDEVIAAIGNDQILDIVKHPNKSKYPNQELMIVNVKGYVYVVPFVEHDDGGIFLKTLYPSRKAKKYYLSGDNTHES